MNEKAKNLRLKNWAIGSVIIALFLGYACVILTNFTRSPYANETNRNVMLGLWDKTGVGDSHLEVLQNYWSLPESELSLSTENADCWFVRMPGEIFASDWVLNLAFTDGRVTSVMMRSTDGPKPHGAPEDSGSGRGCGY